MDRELNHPMTRAIPAAAPRETDCECPIHEGEARPARLRSRTFIQELPQLIALIMGHDSAFHSLVKMFAGHVGHLVYSATYTQFVLAPARSR